MVSFSSGSRGNSLVVFSENTAVVIDVGISAPCIKRGLKVAGAHLAPQILVTHAHSDHVGYLYTYSEQFAPDVYCFAPAYYTVSREMAGGRLIAFDGDFFVGDFTVSPFRVSHDVPCVGYSVYHAGNKLSVVTDLGKVTEAVFEAIKGSDLVFLEANYDESMLMNNANYPAVLKRRILSDRGHLSNEAAGAFAVRLAEAGTRQLILGHLSEQNNYPELAYRVVSGALAEKGIEAGKDVHIDVAGYNRVTKVFSVT